MDAATRERAFEPFFTTRPERGGSGLGLATVFGVVRQSQGHLRVESEPGEGARFEIWLPPVEGRPRLADEEPDDGPELEPGSGSVLVLEDDPSVRKLAVEILRSCGYDAVAAAGRDDALAAARERAVDLLVADMRLARRDGGDVADEVRAVRPRVRVLYLAGQGDAAWLDGTLGESDAAFLHKPFTPASLSHCVRELLEGRA